MLENILQGNTFQSFYLKKKKHVTCNFFVIICNIY